MVRVLFVCLGNICRSPTAEGVFRTLIAREGLADRVSIDSAGTAAWHIGKPPDDRAQREALRRGIDISGLRARQARSSDFDRFDYVVAMDRQNYRDLKILCPPGREDRLHLFLDFAPHLSQADVPDPYYGGSQGFQLVYDMVSEAAEGLMTHILARWENPCAPTS